MDLKNIGGIVAGLVIAVVLLASVLVPIISTAMITIGEEASFDNTVRETYTYNVWDGEDVTFVFTKDNTANTYTVNGDSVTLTAAQNILIASNFFSMRTGGQATNPGINYQYQGLTAGAEATLTYAISNGAYTLTIGETVFTGDLEWMVYAVADGETGTSDLGQLTTPSSRFYTSDAQNIVVLGNIYTTGDNDTYYAYYNGDLTVNEEYASMSSVDISKTVKDGYTNIYNTSVTVQIGEESFTPYFILAPITVNGNEASGAMYDLLGIIPLLVTVGILMGIVTAVFVRRE